MESDEMIVVDEVVESLDKLADLLADSPELLVKDLPGVQTLNAAIHKLQTLIFSAGNRNPR